MVILTLCSFMHKEHEFYFSVMTMEKNMDTNSLETEFRIFTDDLETALGQNDDYFLRLGDEREVPEADSLIFDYVFDKIKFSGKGWNDVHVKYLGKEVEHDFTYVYVEYSNVSSWGEVSVTNSILFEHFEDQENQLSVIHEGQIKTTSCLKAYPTRTVNLNP